MLSKLKNVISLFLFVIILFCFISLPAYGSDINIMLDGKNLDTLTWAVKPFNQNGRIMVPVRYIVEALNGQIDWINNGEFNGIEIIKDNMRIASYWKPNSLEISGTPMLKVGLKGNIEMDIPPHIVDGRTVIPLRYISEALLLTVQWDGETHTVKLTSKIPGTNTHLSDEWEKTLNILSMHSATIYDLIYKLGIDYNDASKLLFDLFTLKENKGTFMYANYDTEIQISVDENSQSIHILSNNSKLAGNIEEIVLNILVGFEDYASDYGDRLKFAISDSRRSAIATKNNITADIEAKGETDKYSYTIKEYNQSGGYLGTCDLREILIIRKTNG